MIYYNLNHVFEKREVPTVEVSYKKLWKILIDKDMKKKDLQAAAGISWASVTKDVYKRQECIMSIFCSLVTEDCNIFHSQSTVKTLESASQLPYRHMWRR